MSWRSNKQWAVVHHNAAERLADEPALAEAHRAAAEAAERAAAAECGHYDAANDDDKLAAARERRETGAAFRLQADSLQVEAPEIAAMYTLAAGYCDKAAEELLRRRRATIQG